MPELSHCQISAGNAKNHVLVRAFFMTRVSGKAVGPHGTRALTAAWLIAGPTAPVVVPVNLLQYYVKSAVGARQWKGTAACGDRCLYYERSLERNAAVPACLADGGYCWPQGLQEELASSAAITWEMRVRRRFGGYGSQASSRGIYFGLPDLRSSSSRFSSTSGSTDSR